MQAKTGTDLMQETVPAVKGVTADVKGMMQNFKKPVLQAQQRHRLAPPYNSNHKCSSCARRGHLAQTLQAAGTPKDGCKLFSGKATGPEQQTAAEALCNEQLNGGTAS